MSSLAQTSIINQPPQPSAPSVDELMSGLRPLKPAVELALEPEPFPYEILAWGVVGVVILTLLSWWIWKRLRREKSLTPEQTAMQCLDEIAEADLGNDDFIMKVSHTLKGYLEEKKLFTAVRQTTEEFLHSLKNSEKLSEQRETLKTFFGQCDLVKFAGGNLTDEQRRELIDSVRSLVKGISQSESDKS